MMDIISIPMSIGIALLFFMIGAIGSLILRNRKEAANWWGNAFAFAGSVFGLIASALVFLKGETFEYILPSFFPLLSFSLRLDHLSAFFIFIISLAGALCSLYAVEYVKHFYQKYSLGALGFFYNLFILSMMLVALANNALMFLVVWEIMSLASYFLVIYERHKAENLRAGYVYFIMTHLGTACIVLLFLLLYRFTGSFDFEIIKNHANAIPSLFLNASFLLALVGFGAKAGIIPFHIWLPGAHPAAPSHVSALMSGVMIKMGVYMLIRITIDILPEITLWWGLLVMIAGAVSAVLGVLYALTEHDIKRLLAYHSIENIGIILLGFGSALTLFSLNMPALAMVGIVAALFHTLNHAVFKSLLFLSAGSVISQMHTRNIEKYGGLIKYMPHAAFFFLIGSVSISALPPFNGFFSEWLTFQSLFSGIGPFAAVIKWIFVFSAGALALTSGLAMACFVKVFGISFLARPRSEKVIHARDPGFYQWVSMGIFSALALMIGLFSVSVVSAITKIVVTMSHFQGVETPISVEGKFLVREGFAELTPSALFWALLIGLIAVYAAMRVLIGKRTVRRGATWDCGTTLTSRMEVTSLGFARSLVTIFRGVLKPTQQSEIEYRDANMRYFSRINFTDETRDIYREYFYHPLQNGIVKIARHIKKIQMGNVNVYVLYILITLIGLLIFAALQ